MCNMRLSLIYFESLKYFFTFTEVELRVGKRGVINHLLAH